MFLHLFLSGGRDIQLSSVCVPGLFDALFIFFTERLEARYEEEFNLRTPISALFVLKQAHSGEKAISPNIHRDVPALLENLSTSQVITTSHFKHYNGCCE